MVTQDSEVGKNYGAEQEQESFGVCLSIEKRLSIMNRERCETIEKS